MQRTRILSAAFFIALVVALFTGSAQSSEPFLRQLPPGLYLKSSTEIPEQQAQAIGKKLGGEIERLTNSILQVHGRTIQLNAVTAVDESSAKAMHAALLKIKPYPYCLRKGALVIEYVGRNIDVPLAMKTSYELGLLEKPDRLRYRVVADLATVEQADYMACNPLFNHFIALGRGANKDAISQIEELSKKFKFGRSLVLRKPKLGDESTMRRFEPAATATNEADGVITYSFDELPNRRGVPYVTVTMEITVDRTGLLELADPPSNALIAATPFWPADDPQIKTLAQQITQGKTDNRAKAMAILQWLSPGNNIKYSGQTGSRWGVVKVLQQKFGHCWDFSDCFVTLARAAGVPSRQTAGWLYGSSGHVWAEYYREGKGWQQVDPTGGGELQCGIYHIPYFTSENGETPILYLSMPRIEAIETE